MRRPSLALACALMLAPMLASAQTPAPATPIPAAPAQGAPSLPALIVEPGDPGNVDEVVLPEKAVLSLSGKGTWEEGYKTIEGAFGRIRAELKRLGLPEAGRPIAIFTDTTDDAFVFQAMIPIAATPTPAPDAPGFKFSTTPSGKAYRFSHKAAYEEIDSTYETITTYLDAKDIVAKDAFIEEYVTDAADATDPKLEINIYVQPK